MGALTDETGAKLLGEGSVNPNFKRHPVGTFINYKFVGDDDQYSGEVLGWDTSKKVPDTLKLFYYSSPSEKEGEKRTGWFNQNSVTLVDPVPEPSKKSVLINIKDHPVGSVLKVRITHENFPPVEDIVKVDEWIFTNLNGQPAVYDHIFLKAGQSKTNGGIETIPDEGLYLPAKEVEVLEVIKKVDEKTNAETIQDPRDHSNFRDWPPHQPSSAKNNPHQDDIFYHIAEIKRLAKEKGLTASITLV